jgi:L-threonylcarbamoyladenylate synthase
VTDVLHVDPDAPDAAAIARAADVLRRGGLVAFPTETVYGLGAHALDRAAVRRIFTAKGRPATDPLIVHVAHLAQVDELVERLPESARRLAARFWPGPLTLVLRRSAAVPDEVTAGLDTVAIRIPAHPVARALLSAAAVPVAAPSANLFSRPSPTRAEHVLQDLDGRIDLVIDGGPTQVGVESTVLDLSAQPTVLRPGAVTLEMLRAELPGVTRRTIDTAADGAMPSPGMLTKHYAPRAPLILLEGPAGAVLARITLEATAAIRSGRRVGILAADDDVLEVPEAVIQRVGPGHDLGRIAAGLYAALRALDAIGVDLIFARGYPAGDGLGVAIQDRLRRAASGRVIQVPG